MRATWLLLLCACLAAPTQVDDVPQPDPNVQPMQAQPPQQQPSDPQVVCDMAKFSFTQASGCVNDGWVEFCADKSGGTPVTNALRGIAADVQITEGEVGAAGCDEVNDFHVVEPIHSGDCMAPHGALTDDAWGRFCALSQVPATKHFVPGFTQ